MYNTNLIVYTLLWMHTNILSVDGTTNSFIIIYLLRENTRIFATHILTLIAVVYCLQICSLPVVDVVFVHLIQHKFSFLPLICIRIIHFSPKKQQQQLLEEIVKQTINTNTCPFDPLCHRFIHHKFKFSIVIIMICLTFLFYLLALIGYFYTGTRAKQSRESTNILQKTTNITFYTPQI